MKRLAILILATTFFSCQEKNNPKPSEKIINLSENQNNSTDSLERNSPNKSAVLSFLDIVINKTGKKEFGLITIEADKMPNGWIKPQDIDTLITLVKSKQSCTCVVDPMSSNLHLEDSAELGGYAIQLLQQYKEKKDTWFILAACPKVDEKEADELIKWWGENKQ